MPCCTWASLAFMALTLMADRALGQPTLSTSEIVSQTGHFQLLWQYNDDENIFELQQARTPNFANPRTIYTGPERARTMSGMLNGTYYFRVRAQASPWSQATSVKVQHYELSTAFIFLGLGAIVFFATAILVIRGHLEHRRTHTIANE